MPARPPVFGASTGNTRTGITAFTTLGGGGGNSPATRDGIGACGLVWDCGDASATVSEEDTASSAGCGAAVAAAAEGCAAGFAAADKSAALKMPLRLSASTKS